MRLERLSAVELTAEIRGGNLSCTDVVEYFIKRIKRLDGKLNSFITICEKEALERAEKLDERIRRGEISGKLLGLPVAIKDNISTRGIRTTCASKMLENYVPPYDATVVERLLAEGAVIIGKTNMDEFAMGSTTETSYFGPTRNPWDLDRVPGGSSGGSAAAIAAGLAPLSLGSDTGGSVRCPASFCGVVGLKPTYGRVSRYGLIAYACSLEQIGPICRNVRDTALLLSAIAGRDRRDSTTAPIEVPNYLESCENDVRGIRIGVVREMLGEGTENSVEKAFWNAIKKLEDEGAIYDEISMSSLEYALPAYYIIAMSEASSNLARYDGVRYGYRIELDYDVITTYSKTRRFGFGEEVKRRIMLGTFALSAGYYGRYYLKALKVRTLVKRDFERALKRFDVLAGPTMPMLPFRIGEKITDPLELYMCDIDTVPANLAGIPAISVPAGFERGLPVGIQFMAGYFREDLLLRVSYTLESILNLRDRFPEL